MVRRRAGFVAIAGVLIGLFAMHTLGLHGTSVPAPSATVAVAAHGDASAADHAAGAPHAHAAASHSCPECTDSHAGMAAMCLSIVLAVAISILLLRPRLFRRWSVPPPQSLKDLWRPAVTARPPRPPSLHVLCISRT